jgi:hypothetical protein
MRDFLILRNQLVTMQALQVLLSDSLITHQMKFIEPEVIDKISVEELEERVSIAKATMKAITTLDKATAVIDRELRQHESDIKEEKPDVEDQV